MNDATELPIVEDELSLLNDWVGLNQQNIIELGCGAAKLSRELLKRFPGCRVTGLEVDGIQHQKNLENPQQGLTFLAAGAQEIPVPDATFDLAMRMDCVVEHGIQLASILRPEYGNLTVACSSFDALHDVT